jgi:hypothetical protein
MKFEASAQPTITLGQQQKVNIGLQIIEWKLRMGKTTRKIPSCIQSHGELNVKCRASPFGFL